MFRGIPRKIVEAIAILLMLLMLGTLFVGGIELVKGTWPMLTSALRIPKGAVYLLPPLLPGQLARTLTRQPGATSMTSATGNTSAMGLATGSAWKSMKCVSRNFCSARRPWKTGLCTRLNQASTCRKAGSGSKMIFWLMATLRKFCPLCQRTNSFTCKIIFMVKFSVYWYNLRCRNGGFTR